MKIAIPLQHGNFCAHFGGAESFVFFDVDEAGRTIGEPYFGTPPEHGRGIYPVWLQKQGATVVLSGGMGPRAIGILAQQGIEAVVGVRGESPEKIVGEYLEGTLETSGEPCLDHGFHDCVHDHALAGGGCRH